MASTYGHVFLERDTVVEPDTVSQHLMRSGDVESNPGPVSCGDCNQSFSHRSKPIKCKECNRQYCRTRHRDGTKVLCSGLTRWQLEKVEEEGKEWKCSLCKGHTPQRVHQHNVGITPGKCKGAKCVMRKIKAKTDFLVCHRCQGHYHKQMKCCEMTRKQVEVLDRAIWQCPSCSEIIPTPSEATETPGESCYGIAPTSGTTIRILQLNIDSLMSKIEELKRFLKKHNIDVFVLQETKLIKNDRSPRIPGYTIIRKDRQQPKGKERNRGGGLITGIRDTIPYKHANIEIRGAMDRLTEWLTVEIPTRKGKMRITNVYVPPVRNNRPRQQGTATPRVRDGTGVAEATVAPMNEVAESGATSTQDHRYLTRSRGVTPGEAHE